MLSVEKLSIKLNEQTLVDNISFEVKKSLGIVGMSGSGKSLTLKAILGMLPKNMILEFKYKADFELIKGKNVSFVPQNPFTALSPMSKIKDQIFVSRSKIKPIFNSVDLNLDLINRYPIELSGGQLQRIILAIALLSDPKIILLDEPTTALDTTSKNMVLEIVKKLQAEYGFLLLFVGHDMSAVADVCDEIFVMKDGKKIEYDTKEKILYSPKDSYTKLLIASSFVNREFRQ